MSETIPGASYGVPESHFSSKLIGHLRRHPILALFLLSPGIPEYLSGSSQLGLIVLDPLKFLLLLSLNTGLYLSGVLLIREAKLRWHKGWSSVLLLSFAYAIVEEGLALRTLYDPNSPVVGTLGLYGHWLGINWVWTVGLLLFHSVFSIALPIFLFHLAFPSLTSKSLVSGKKLGWPIVALSLDTILLSLISRYSPGSSILIFSAIVAGVFTIAARKLPPNFLRPSSALPSRGPFTIAVIGALFFPVVILGEALAEAAGAPPVVPMLVNFLVAFALGRLAFRFVGREQNQTHKVALAAGLLVPVAAFGLIASLGNIPLVLGADAGLALFTRRLWRRAQVLSLKQFVPVQLGIDPTRVS